MNFHPSRLRSIAWVAVLAVLLGALMPTAGRVLASGPGALQDVCSAAAEPLAAGEMPEGHVPQLPDMDVCAYCVVHAGSFGVGVETAPALPVSPQAAALPEARPLVSAALDPCRLPPPRAPPEV